MKQTRILFFADSHLGFDHPIKSTSRPRRGPDFFRNFQQILSCAQNEAVDLVIHGGDLFDRSKVHPKILNRAYDAMFEFVDGGIPMVLVPGNHDRSTLPSGLFLQHPNLYIFREPSVFDFHLNGCHFQLAGFPFVRNIGQEINGILGHLHAKLDPSAIALLCMHQAVEGAVVGPAKYTFRAGTQVIAMSDLKGPFQAYLSGHIHPHQILATEGGMPFIYPGSIERTSFAEKDEEKGYLILTFTANQGLETEFMQLQTRPLHVFKLDKKHDDKELLIYDVKQWSRNLAENAVVRFDSPTETASHHLSSTHFKSLFRTNQIVRTRHLWINHRTP